MPYLSSFSGNFYDPSGKLVATVVPGTGVDNGMVTASGYLFIDARMTIQWKDDSTLAFLYFSGVGCVHHYFLLSRSRADSTRILEP